MNRCEIEGGPVESTAKTGRLGSGIMKNSKESEYCTICRRLLDNPADPLSGNCGGDCWGCIGSIEADMGCAESLAYVRKEYEAGLRRGFGEGFQVEDNQATKKNNGVYSSPPTD